MSERLIGAHYSAEEQAEIFNNWMNIFSLEQPDIAIEIVEKMVQAEFPQAKSIDKS